MATPKAEFVAKVDQAISGGHLDNYLDQLVDSIHSRRVALKSLAVADNMTRLSKPGTRVRISGRVRPQYLLGMAGKVVERPAWAKGSRYGTIYVDIGRAVGRGRTTYGPILGVPANCLDAA